MNAAQGRPATGPYSFAELTRSLSRPEFLDRWMTGEELRGVLPHLHLLIQIRVARQ